MLDFFYIFSSQVNKMICHLQKVLVAFLCGYEFIDLNICNGF